MAQVRRRLKEIRQGRAESEASELYELMLKAEKELSEGRDLLAQMAARTRAQISRSQRRLMNLQRVNQAAAEYVKERYEMDISDFRQAGKK